MKKSLLALLLGISALLFACESVTTTFQTTEATTATTSGITTASPLIPGGTKVNKSIRKVDEFPEIIDAFAYYDYLIQARRLDEIVFDFANTEAAIRPSYQISDPSTWQPIGFWIDQPRQPEVYEPLVSGYLKRSFGLPTYLGDNRVLSSGTEAMTNLAMVLGSTYAGIDKSAQTFNTSTYDLVEMMMAFYDTGSKLVHNGGVQGQSFWYDIFPQILFARLYANYPDIEYMQEMVLNGADEWLEALPYFETEGATDYEFVAYNVTLESPTVIGDHIEPPNGGLAFLLYSAYMITEDEKYLEGTKEVLDYFQDYSKNPNYEAMTDYAPYVAAILNQRFGTNYDVGKFLDFLFENDSAFRPNWTVMSGFFGSTNVSGLVGDAGAYAFSMNTFHLAGVLAPLVKYDPRYADAIGEYLQNVVNNAKVFFPQETPLANQSMPVFLDYDRYGSICYEGYRSSYGGVQQIAMGDATTMFDQPSDLSLYSSAFIGMLGGMVSDTNVHGILRYDLNVTDDFGDNDHQHYLFYNPYETAKTVAFNGGEAPYDLFDLASNTLLAKNVTGSVNLDISGSSAIVAVVLPGDSRYEIVSDLIYANDKLIAKIRTAVNIDLGSRQELTAASLINIHTEVPSGDEISVMRIYFNEILAYEGQAISTFSYDKSILPDTDYELKIEIVTANGLTDYVTKRVICR